MMHFSFRARKRTPCSHILIMILKLLLVTGSYLALFNLFSVLTCVFCFPIFRVLTELVSKMRDMQMDKTELGCLRAIVLFNPGTTLYVMLPVKNVFLMTKI